MGHAGDQIVAVLTAIIGVAILSVILSNKSNTSGVISSASQAFASMLSTAVSPITGSVQNSYGPSSGFAGNSFSGLNSLSLPTF